MLGGVLAQAELCLPGSKALEVRPAIPVREPDYLAMACTAASASYKGKLGPGNAVVSI